MATTPPKDLESLPTIYCHAWAARDPSPLLALFTTDSCMTDHGAQIHVPYAFLKRHHKHWNGAHKDFEVYLDKQYPVYWAEMDADGNGYCSFRTVNKGIFVNDLGRRKATGLPFEYSGVIDLKLRAGKIAQADEWLRVPFEDSVSPDKYIKISEESLKGVMRKDLHKDA
ncbi:hypothetical protein CABS01_08166 [Colletotrichum abscissum]|uniref:SnoaL-like domain-containing protein n=3 Tax=Colletotrichum acutatum species complex TaxID=2707335 RepID=A0A9P9X650_9PEZI|nr:uncharacterized protein CLUP02_13241 [Colletotrichum lupini]XP_060402332.1 uncharacterized protein CABS01_08166 [Colletotrichum abscissum]KAK1454813.1 hypothetical protein CMEL01_03573 [Colletotrichum melonis]KAI3538331.1 hypothetical protein CABS02_11787 [Colletotrichum abscissum]KAK1508936.1 hypothetical protein CABS01_08166 [Colletotrichum abscissum]UQC87722.1 hypothetical protein CLUP02_13241 [Colletotrichum lupini]